MIGEEDDDDHVNATTKVYIIAGFLLLNITSLDYQIESAYLINLANSER